MQSFTDQGLDAVALEQTAARMAQVRTMLERETARFLAKHASVAENGAVTVDIAAFCEQTAEMQQRILGDIVRMVGGLDYLPRFAKLQSASETIAQAGFKRLTLGHCLVARRRSDLRIERESRFPSDGTVGQPAAKGIFAIV
jgi:hypothetical protein